MARIQEVVYGVCFVLVSFCAFHVDSLFNVYPRIQPLPVEGDPGEPLFLTPLIEEGRIKEAQRLALVGVGINEGCTENCHRVKSYSGYLTVNKTFNSNLFFWFFPAETNSATAPVILWLQGGPGASSLFGLFTENGPFSITRWNFLKRRKYSWTKTHSVIYIDNPVGTGFSFTENDAGYARNETAVGKDLYNALVQFFTLFPELQKNDFYVTGESYGGKYVPAVSYTIHTQNPTAKLQINFKGMAIGNGLSDPEHMLKYGDYLYQLGLIDSRGRDLFHEREELGVKYIQEKNWDAAFHVFDALLNGDLLSTGTLFYNLTGFLNYFNYLNDKPLKYGGDIGEFVQLTKVRRAIHVGNRTYNDGTKVEVFLKEDIMQSVRPWVEQLLGHYRVLVYNGQLDIIVAYPLTESYLQVLKWGGAEEYRNATRQKWLVDGEIAGYSKAAGNLTEVLVRNAGHMVPTDQPKWAMDLINRFTSGKPFHE
ncbi:venom serine carboxypeptidase [Schistocerca cancellata]|uniref:venom serine carboxypeptidase n=1 Tax=Schistocerca cancellata TaxID=274614 RepID=UPI00211865AB|nr:venom serine carboxypeptidase [Schistocerca cancellata]